MSLTQEEALPVLCLAGNQMWFVYSTDQIAQDFIGIYYRVQIDVSGSWVNQCNLMRFEPDSDGNAKIDIHAILQWDPMKEFDWPESSQFLLLPRVNLVRRFRIQVYEKYGNPLVVTDYAVSGGNYLLPGKISELRYGKLNDQSSTFWDEIFANNVFLTNSPRIKKTDASAPERLFHYVLSAATTSLKLWVKIYYTYGTNDTLIKNTITPVTAHIVYEIITSFNTLQLPYDDVTGPIEKYDVWLTDQSDVILSEAFTYLVDHTSYDNVKYFLFANAFKMFEGARFVNHLETYSKSEQTDLLRKLPKGFGVMDSSMIKDAISEVVYCDVSSEWLSPAEIQWLRELALSKEVYEIVDGQPVPIRVKAASVVTHEKDKNLRHLKMTYSYGHADSVPADYSDFST